MAVDPIAVAVEGAQNFTRISSVREHTADARAALGRFVATRDPDRTYYLVSVDKATGGSRWKRPLYVWHVGEGFEHREGWWVHVEE